MAKRIAYSELWLAVGSARTLTTPIKAVTGTGPNFTPDPEYVNIYRDLENDPTLTPAIGTRIENSNSHGRENVFHNIVNQRAELSITVPFPNSTTIANFMSSWIYKILQISYNTISASGDTDTDLTQDAGETWTDIIAKNQDLDCGRYGQLIVVSPSTVHVLLDVKAKIKIMAKGGDDDFPKMEVVFYGLYAKMKGDSTTVPTPAILGASVSPANVVKAMQIGNASATRVERADKLSINSVNIDFADEVEFDSGRDIKFYQYIKSATANSVGAEYLSSGYKPRLTLKGFSDDTFNNDSLANLSDTYPISFYIGNLKIEAPACILAEIPNNPETDGWERTEKTFVLKRDSNRVNYKFTFTQS